MKTPRYTLIRPRLQHLSLLALIAMSFSSHAASLTWVGNTDTNLATGANWDTTTAPVSGDSWIFGAPGSAGATLTNTLTSSGFNVAGITFNTAATTGYNISGNAFTLTGNISATSASAVTHTIANNIEIASGSHTVALGGGGNTVGVVLSGNLTGSGSIAQTGVSGGVTRLTLSGDNSGFTGSFSNDNAGSTRTSFSTSTAGSASAAWTFSKATNGGISLGFSSGTINFGSLSGGGFIRQDASVASNITVSVGALNTDTTFSGIFSQGNSTKVLTLNKVGTGTLTLSGNSATPASTTGYAGGTVIKQGTIHITNIGALGTGAVTIGDATVGANATLSENIGTNTVANNIVVASGNGTRTISGVNGGGSTLTYSGTVALSNDLIIKSMGAGVGNTGTLALSGVVSGTGNLIIDGGSTGNGSAKLGNAANTFAGNVTIQNNGTLLTVNGALGTSHAVTIDSTSQLNTAGASLSIAGLNGSGSTVNSGGTLTLGGSGTYSYGGVISNSGGLTKSGSGTQTLTGANTYAGATSVTGGKLIVNGSLASASVTVATGATLGGSGTISGATTIQSGGTLSAGNSPGLLTFSDALTLGGTTLFEIGGTTRGTEYDAVDVGGVLTYGGALNIVAYDLGGGLYDLAQAASFDLFGINGSATGDFASVTVGGNTLTDGDLDGVWTGVDSGNGDVTYSFSEATGDLTVTVVPEPAAALLGGLGLLGLLRRRRTA